MRPILPASPHARGRRPYTFAADWQGPQVPGAIVKGRRIYTAVDAAWLMEGAQCVDGPAGFPLSAPGILARSESDPGSSPLSSYQIEGAAFLACRDYGVLADEMGLGKTVQALWAAESRLQLVRGAHTTAPHVLILCPALAKKHWQREIKKWTGHDSAILEGLTAKDLPQSRYIICNYDIVYGQRRKDAAGKMHESEKLGGWGDVLGAAQFPIVICDEAHMLRGEKSRRTQAVKKLADKSTCVWLLTGTPMPNHVRDLWTLWDLCSKGLAGYFWPWAKAYCGAYKGQYGWVADGQSGLDELGRRLAFFMLGRTKSAVALQLPEKRREIVQVDVGKVPSAANGTEFYGIDLGYDPPVVSTDSQNSKQRRTNAVAMALRATAFAKKNAIVDMAAEALLAGQKVVVFLYLRDSVETAAVGILQHDTKAKLFPIHGGQSPEARDAAATAFREHIGPACFVATIDSAGVAISLVGADLVIFGDLSWEPSKLLQAEGRTHRYGSTTRVLVRYVIAAGTVDEAVQEVVIEKLTTVEAALGGMGDGSELSVQLGRDMSTSDQILDRLFQALTGGK